ncbi:MAG: endonuclease III domain-containing protein [Planctomycetota bacterium]|jgi:endonuclease-3
MKPNHRARCARINRALVKHYGEPKWPGPQDPLEVLVRTILTQSTAAANSERAYKALRGAYATWEGLADAKIDAVARAIRPGGLAKRKAKHIVKLVRDLRKEYGAASLEFIKSMSVREAMRALNGIEGVGPKTGACVILFALGREICPVDTHIHRILQRIGIFQTSVTPEAAFEILQPLVPAGSSYAFHVNLIRLGREVCKAGKPRCSSCPVETECRYPSKTSSRR